MNTRNVTVALDEETARWLRVEAAKNDTSVSKHLADLLRDRMAQDHGYEHAMHSFLGRAPTVLKTTGGYPSRDQRHDRARLR